MDAVLFYPCLEDETISLCLCKLLQSRFLFVCLFVSCCKFVFPFTFVFVDRFGPSRNISLVGFNNRN